MVSEAPPDGIGIAMVIGRDEDGYLVIIHIHSQDGSVHEVHGHIRYLTPEMAKEQAVQLITMMEQVLGGVFGQAPEVPTPSKTN